MDAEAATALTDPSVLCDTLIDELQNGGKQLLMTHPIRM